METITSRRNPYIAHLRRLAADGDYRRACFELVCDGEKLLREALASGVRVTSVLTAGEAPAAPGATLYRAPADLVAYASPLKNSPGPVFTAALPDIPAPDRLRTALVLENVQDPGNVGTVVRTADALGVEAVFLAGDCADLYAPRAARATMGAVFRQPVFRIGLEELPGLLRRYGLDLYGAALEAGARDIRTLSLRGAAVAVGNEGSGLSEELLGLCRGTLVVPMTDRSESLNAATAAAIVMWEMVRA